MVGWLVGWLDEEGGGLYLGVRWMVRGGGEEEGREKKKGEGKRRGEGREGCDGGVGQGEPGR